MYYKLPRTRHSRLRIVSDSAPQTPRVRSNHKSDAMENVPPEPRPPSPENASAVSHWALTQVTCAHVSCTWTVKDFSLCGEGRTRKLKSPTFSAALNDKLKWRLVANPKEIDEESRDYLSLFLILVSRNESEVRAKFKFCILNANREKTKLLDSKIAFRFVKGKDWGFKKFLLSEILLNEANDLLSGDKLTIFCEISVGPDSVNISGYSNAVKLNVRDSRLYDDFRMLFKNQKLSDVTLSVSGREFQAHKSVLAARSPVFAAMFEHDMQERKFNRVEIVDMHPEALGEMLRFIYTGKAANLENLADDLLAAADKYALDRLKVMCEVVLSVNLTAENAAEMVILADLHRARQLKAQAIDLINRQAINVMGTSGWKSLLMHHPHLIQEVTSAYRK